MNFLLHPVGENEIIRCFSCGLGFVHWNNTDDLWTEHARHSPKCNFLINEKGETFVKNVQKKWKKV